MKTLQVKKKNKTIVIVQINWNSEKSIDTGESMISKLVNKGYNLDTTHAGFTVTNFTFILNH